MDERKLPFTIHLRDLRIRLRNALLALLIACGGAFYFADTLFQLLARPLARAWHLAGLPNELTLKFASLTEPFWVYFELSIYAGVFIASPVIFHQLWKFIAPGLYDKEKRIAIPFAVCSALMFIGGGLFCYYFVLPAAFKFFLSYSTANIAKMGEAMGNAASAAPIAAIAPELFMLQYMDLGVKMLLGFGVVFELPLAIFFMSYVGIVTHRGLWKWNKYWVILSFVIGGVLTPGPDIMSQLLMATPLIVLYNISIVIAWVVTRRRESETVPA